MPNLMAAVVGVPVAKTKVFSGIASLVAYSSGAPTDPAVPVLVFLHAGVCDSRMWAGQFDRFAATHRVVSWDRRGFGATAAADEHFSSVDDLFAVMDTLQIERAVLVGCSQGGRIALDATLARPERVAGLVLVAAAIGGAPEPEPHDARLDALMAAWDEAAADGDFEAQNRIEAHVWLDGPFETEGRVQGAPRELFLAMNRIVLAGPKFGSTDTPDTAWTRLADVAAPTLLVWGLLDVPSVVDNMRHAAATIPGARTLVIDDVAHLPNLEVPERFDAALSAFLHETVR